MARLKKTTIPKAEPGFIEAVGVKLKGLTEVAPAQRPKVPGCAPFLLATHPRRWRVDHEFGLVPDLTRISLEPGANHIGRDGSYSRLQVKFAEQGFTILKNTEDYLSGGRKNHRGETYHLPLWVRPINGTADTRPDRKRFGAFLKSVAESAKRPPHSMCREKVAFYQKELIEQKKQAKLTGDANEALVTRIEHALKCWQNELTSQEAAE